jgi:hypothetical protein
MVDKGFDQILTAQELAQRLGVSKRYVETYSRESCGVDVIPSFKFGKVRRYGWNSPALNAWIQRHVAKDVL